MVQKFTKYADKIGIVMTVMSPDYEGGDFCAGLTAAYEVKTVALEVMGGMIKNLFTPRNDKEITDDIAE